MLKLLSIVGDTLYLDTIDIGKARQGLKSESHVAMTFESNYHSYGFNWPYFSYATQQQKVLIMNAFNPNFIQRYALP